MQKIIRNDCPKCGCDNSTVEFCQGIGGKKKVTGCEISGEHLHRKCSRCNYEWTEGCLDAKK